MIPSLELINEALSHLGERPLSSMKEDREAARTVVASAPRSIRYCFESGQWNFATVASVMVPDPDAMTDAEFGNRYVYKQPEDMLRLSAICRNPYFTEPMLNYETEGKTWITDDDRIYVKYIREVDEGEWTVTFRRYVALQIALDVCMRLTGDQGRYNNLFQLTARAKNDAASLDASEQPTQFTPPGSWVRSRYVGYRRHRP